MSGGVDSSVAAHLLQREGYEVWGVFMQQGVPCRAADQAPAAGKDPDTDVDTDTDTDTDTGMDAGAGAADAVGADAAFSGQSGTRTPEADDARWVAQRLGFPLHVLDVRPVIARVIDYFVDEYVRGRTPNPCVKCNIWLKFGYLFDYASQLGAEFVATGHHARLRVPESGLPELHAGADRGKDQSYVLFGIDREKLRRIRLPIGAYPKREVRRIARELGLRVADKRDSQEICFVAPGQHAQLVRQRRTGSQPPGGQIVTVDGQVVGSHDGLESFTIGQRKGLGVALGQPYYVVRIEAGTRRVVIGRREDLARRELTATPTRWLIDPPSGPWRCQAKIRYNAAPAEATAERLDGDRLRIVFDRPCYGVAPGQAVVCYDGTRVLGGGWIE